MSPPTTPPIRVFLVEDHELTRQGLAYGLSRHSHIQVMGEAEDGHDALQQLATWHTAGHPLPQVILMDIVMPNLNGLQATQAIKTLYPDSTS